MKHIAVLAAFLVATGVTQAKECIKESDVTKWEVLSVSKMVAYSGDKYLAFVDFFSYELKVGGNVTLRVFSPTICELDRVILNGTETGVREIKRIREQ